MSLANHRAQVSELLDDWGAAYKPAAKDAWQARAALQSPAPQTKGGEA